MLPDLSVVVPACQRPAQLGEAVASALADRDVNVEVIVVDDGPDGSARDVVARLSDPRVRYVKMPSPSRGRPARVRNVGWPEARAPLVHFLDDDDRVAPGAYRAMVGALREHPDRGVAFGRVAPFGEDAAAVAIERESFDRAYERARLAGKLGSRHFMVANLLFLHSFLVTSACVIRRDRIAEVGGFDPDLAVVEDLELYARAMRRFGYVFLDQVVLEYRISSGSLMHGDLRREALDASYRRMHARYRRAWGDAEFFGMKLVARGLLRPAFSAWSRIGATARSSTLPRAGS